MEQLTEIVNKFGDFSATPMEGVVLAKEYGCNVSMTARGSLGLPMFFFRADEEDGFMQRLRNAASTYGIEITSCNMPHIPIKTLLKAAMPGVFYVNASCDGCAYFYGRGLAASVMTELAQAQSDVDDEEREKDEDE